MQCTEENEFPYHEMMAHLPLFCHPNPKKVIKKIRLLNACIFVLVPEQVLVIGGGDGGAIREIDKHSLVEEIHQCELDEVY